jgi:uncharacterized protein YjbI with pentapeptide repeats
MADAETLAALKQGAEVWAKWRETNRTGKPDLRGAILAGTDLGDADLSGADLAGADFRSAKLGKCNLAGADLREAVFEGADLSAVVGLRPGQLAGADLAGARLPDSLTGLFKDLETASGISDSAQKLFVAMLAACLYSWLTIATTTDVSLVTNRGSSPLPIIQASIPIVAFYVVTPLLLLGVYLYFHLYLQKLWEELGSLPAIFPDGRPLQAKADPWLLSDLVRSHVSKLSANRPFLSYLQQWISVLLGWWVVPITLLLFWVRYLPRHDLVGTVFHCVLTGISIAAAVFLYRLAGRTLRGTARVPFAWRAAATSARSYGVAATAFTSAIALAVVSLGATLGVRPGHPDQDCWPVSHGPRTWAPRAMALLRYSPFADLTAADLSLKPPNWTGKSDAELDAVKGLQLRGVDLRYADIRAAFLPGTVLTDAHLEGADLLLADLRQTELAGAHLDGAVLEGARLDRADLSRASLRGTDLTYADLTGTDLTAADIKGAVFIRAKGLTANQLLAAHNYPDALYDNDNKGLLQELKLTDVRTRPPKQDPEEAALTEREGCEAAQLRRSTPGQIEAANTLQPQLVQHLSPDSTNLKPIPVASSGPASQGAPFSVTEVARLYDFPTDVDGRGQTVGIVEFGGGYRDSDLNAYFAASKRARPNVSWVPVDGVKNSPASGQNSPDSQVELDIEVAGAVAPGAGIVVYFSNFITQGWVDAIQAAEHDTAHKPSVLLIDWGFAETQQIWTTTAMQAVNEELQRAASMGITVIVASGDDGAREQVHDGRAHVDFPASSPWVLGVGGSKLIAAGNSIASEVVWNDGANGGATGGGVSDIFARPAWQAAVRVPARADGQLGRGVPDVAINASPVTGYKVLTDGAWGVIGGTSAAAPLWAGLIALINQSLGHNVGYLNPLLYQQIGPGGALRDITTGDNSIGGVKGYAAGPGWNACTGWGSPDGRKLLEALRAAAKAGH